MAGRRDIQAGKAYIEMYVRNKRLIRGLRKAQARLRAFGSGMQAVGMIDGRKREIVMPGHDKVEVPIIGKKNAQVLSVSGTHANIMDMETYETFDLEVPEELQGKVSEGDTILYWEIMDDKVMKQIMQKG